MYKPVFSVLTEPGLDHALVEEVRLGRLVYILTDLAESVLKDIFLIVPEKFGLKSPAFGIDTTARLPGCFTILLST